MTKEEIFSCIENLCQIYNVHNGKIPDAKGKGYHLFKKGNLYWAWYGTLWNNRKLRIDFVYYPEEPIHNKIYASIKKKLSNRDYEIDVLKKALHIFFVRDIELESVNTEILNNAMRKYQKFMNEDFREIATILQKE